MINEPVIKLRRTPAQQAQRDEFLRNATLARNWLTGITWNAERDDWSEVEFLLKFIDRTITEMKASLPTDRAEPQGN
ncbi:hypothetical protein LED50_26240 [Salmonella enterica]|nr:hypothetical protein [Salmonella enterica]